MIHRKSLPSNKFRLKPSTLVFLATCFLIICSSGCSEDDPPDNWRRLGGTDAPIHALQEYKGRLVFGGEFTTVEAFGPDEEVNHLAAYADPSQQATHPEIWQSIPQATDPAGTWYDINPEPNGTVHAMTIFQGDLIVAGAFTYIGPIRASGIARWDGQEWHSLGGPDQGWGINGIVYALATGGNNRLYAAGSFTEAGNQQATRIASWNGTTWTPLGNGLNNTVYALHSRADQLFAGGAFTEAGGQPANHIARWNGSNWLPLDVGVDGTVRALTTYRGALIAGGDFITVNGFEMNHVARWIGVSWLALGEGMKDFDQVQSLLVESDEIYAGGAVDEAQSAGGTGGVNKWDGTGWNKVSEAGNEDCRVVRPYLSKLTQATTNESGSSLNISNQ